MPQYCEKADCQYSQKRVIAHLWILAVVSQQEAFFTDAWLSPTNKHMAETRKKFQHSQSTVAQRHTYRNRHTSKPHFCLAVVFVSLRPKPPIVELTTERGVGGWSHSARATLAQKKATTQTNSWQGMERQYFSKSWLPSLPQCSLSLPVLTFPLSLWDKLFPWQLFRQCRSPSAGGGWSVYVCVCVCMMGWVGGGGH